MNQWFSRSDIPRPPLCRRWQQTCLQTIGLRPLQSNMERDRWSASRCFLGWGSTDKRWKIKGKIYTAHASTLPFKDNCLRSQVPTWASTSAWTSDQFRSSWRLSLNHTPNMQTVHHSSRKDLTGECHPFRQLAANLHCYQSWSWPLLFARISQPPSSQALCSDSGTQRQWYHQHTQIPLLKKSQQRGYSAGLDLPSHIPKSMGQGL